MALTAPDVAALSRLLDQALDIPAPEREALLAALPEADRHLAPVLREMLAERDSTPATSGSLAALPGLSPEAAPDEAVPGERVGPYELVRDLGRGGMGSVWLAERVDGAFKRQVALKLPRLAWGAGLAERMARERQIEALLEHPNIARLYDAGVDERGRPYLALEYIEGQAIDAWCKQRSLPVAERLKLFVQVVRAVAYAHGRLVVHRDLKPSNVLVTPDGQTHLLDFGIAKLLDDAASGEGGLTLEQGRVLTPHFASPEQLRGEPITVQSDVYSLGVMLYELLTGRMPYRPTRKTLAALEEAILEGGPPLASSRVADKAAARALRGEVDSILTKALRRKPSYRYATADALADDIERHLAGERVLARPDSAWYRLRRVFRRHRLGILATGAVMVAVLIGGTAALVQANRANRAAERERVVKEFVADVFRVDRNTARTDAGAARPTIEALVERGARRVEQRFPGQPALQAELYGVVSGVFADMGAHRLAIDYSTRRLGALGEGRGNATARARTMMVLAESLLAEERLSEAERSAREAVNLTAGDKALAGEALVLLARVLYRLGFYDKIGATLARAEHLLGNPDSPPTATRAWLTYLRGITADKLNQFDLAISTYVQAIDIALRAGGATSKTAVDLRLMLGRRLLIQDRYDEAIAQVAPALAVLESLGGANAVRAAVERAHLWSLMCLTLAIPSEEALSAVRQSRTALDASGIVVPDTLRAKVAFWEAMVLLFRGELTEASALMASSSALLHDATESLGFRFEIVAQEATLAMHTGRHAKANELIREAMDIRRQSGLEASSFAAYDFSLKALNHLMAGELAEAQTVLDGAPNFVEDGSDRNRVETLSWERARLALHQGNPQGALTQMDRLHEQNDASSWCSVQGLRAEALCAAGELTAGLEKMRHVIAARAANAFEHDPVLARYRAVAALCALGIGNRQLARELAQASRAALSAQPDVSPYYKTPLAELDRRLAAR